MSLEKIRIGTRSSPLALRQTDIVVAALKRAHVGIDFDIVPIKSAADWKKADGETALCDQAGGKGQFAKEIETMMLAGEIDCGVHSLKDMASFLPEGLVIHHVLPRADARDAFISEKYNAIEDFPAGAVVGTCSPRRKAWCLNKRPDIAVVPFRGNVKTRLDKVKSGQVDATFLAMAGLERLKINDPMIKPVAVGEMLPACGQGIICLETRVGDQDIHDVLNAIHCPETYLCAVAERAILKELDGSCHTAIGAYAVMKENSLSLKCFAAREDGSEIFYKSTEQNCETPEQAAVIGQQLAQGLKEILPEGVLS